MPYRNPNFQCEPTVDENGVVRVKVTCPRCGATQVGNAAEIIKWQAEHLCAKAQTKS